MENKKDVKVCLYGTTFKDEVRMFISALEMQDSKYSNGAFYRSETFTRYEVESQFNYVLRPALEAVSSEISGRLTFLKALANHGISINPYVTDWKDNLISSLNKLVEPTLQDVYDTYKGNRLDKLKVYAEHLYSITPVQQRAELIMMLKQVTDEDLKHVCVIPNDVFVNFSERLDSVSLEYFSDSFYKIYVDSSTPLCFGHTRIGSLNITHYVLEPFKITSVQIGDVKGYIFPVSTN